MSFGAFKNFLGDFIKFKLGKFFFALLKYDLPLEKSFCKFLGNFSLMAAVVTSVPSSNNSLIAFSTAACFPVCGPVDANSKFATVSFLNCSAAFFAFSKDP